MSCGSCTCDPCFPLARKRRDKMFKGPSHKVKFLFGVSIFWKHKMWSNSNLGAYPNVRVKVGDVKIDKHSAYKRHPINHHIGRAIYHVKSYGDEGARKWVTIRENKGPTRGNNSVPQGFFMRATKAWECNSLEHVKSPKTCKNVTAPEIVKISSSFLKMGFVNSLL